MGQGPRPGSRCEGGAANERRPCPEASIGDLSIAIPGPPAMLQVIHPKSMAPQPVEPSPSARCSELSRIRMSGV